MHFTATTGWINDPHGITYRDGQYHSFYQYVPDQTAWGPGCQWGHAVGPDLLSLRELAVAIAPGQGDDGIWTGCLVTDDDGAAQIFYTSVTTPDVGIGRIRVATPDGDDWLTWSKGDFIVDAPEGLDLIAYRDPFVRREGTGWRMFVGAALRNGDAAALSYTSEDLRQWTYAGAALSRSTAETEPVWMGALWECPQVLEIDRRAFMVSSVWDDDELHYAAYATGSYADGVLTPDGWGRLTFGDSYYAPSLFTDADGRPCLVFWMRGIADETGGWAGVHSVPYLLTLNRQRLVAGVHPDVTKHRAEQACDGRVDTSAADIVWTGGEGGELIIETDAVQMSVRWADGELTVDQRSGTREELTQRAPVSDPVRIVIDGPVVEISSSAGLLGVGISAHSAGLRARADQGVLEIHSLR